MALISVIVPVYKAEAFLRKCTDSILKQTYPNLELLLIDDGSPDESGALCDAIAQEDDRVRVFHKENGGVSSARNLGLEKAAGDYIAFVDSDDWLEPNALEELLRVLEAHNADASGCAHRNVAEDGTSTVEAPALPAGVYGPEKITSGIVNRLLGDRLTQPVLNGFIWRFLYTRSIITENHITFEGAYLEDELFLMEYFCNAEKLAVTEQPLYRYFLNPASATHKYMKDFRQVFARFMERKEDLVGRYGLEEARPLWRENTNWAGLLIAVGNEYAKGNPKSIRQRQKAVKELCRSPEMARAISAVDPQGMTPNKQMVARLIRGGHFFVLTQLYRLKNRI